MRLTVRAAALALLACACAHGAPAPAPTPAAPVEPRAFAWEVTRPGARGKLVVAGSVHLARPGQLRLPPSMEAAFQASQALAVELDPKSIDQSRAQALTLRLGLYGEADGKLSQHLASETRDLLPAALARAGLTQEQVERMRPWFLATMLGMLELHRAGYSADAGIDHQLLARARGKKPILELESVDEQLTALAAVPDPVQDVMLRDQLQHTGLAPVLLASAVSAWEGGNPEALRKLTFEREGDPAYDRAYDALFHARNRRMVERLAPMVDEPRTTFVVVGAGHLVGERGIPAELARRGFQVRQLPRGDPPAPGTPGT